MTVATMPDWAAVGAALHGWVVAGSGLPAEKVVYGQQDAPRPAAPAIIMRVSNIAETGVWVDQEDNPLVFTDKSVTSVNPAGNTLATAAHGLLTGDGPVRIASTIATPGGLLEDRDYWVIAPDADHVQLAATYDDTGGGQGAGNPPTAIDITSAGSGTITISCTADTRRAGQELISISRGYLNVSLEIKCHSVDPVGASTATALLQRVRGRRSLPGQQARLEAANIGLIGMDHVAATLGTRDAALFEPRAIAVVHFCVPSQEWETETIITSVEVTNLLSGGVFVVK